MPHVHLLDGLDEDLDEESLLRILGASANDFGVSMVQRWDTALNIASSEACEARDTFVASDCVLE